MLLSLPGPPLRRRVLQKISNLARQIDAINAHFLETKLLSRILVLNIFSIPSETASVKEEGQGTLSPDPQALSTPSAPFSEYTLTIFHPFQAGGTARLTAIDHSGLVKGSEGMADDQNWVVRYMNQLEGRMGFSKSLAAKCLYGSAPC